MECGIAIANLCVLSPYTNVGLYIIRLVRILCDATPTGMLSPTVAMAAEVDCQQPPAGPAVAGSEHQLPWQPPGST